MRYRAVIGGMLVCIVGLVAISFRSGPASTTAGPANVAEHSPPPVSFKVDPAEHFKRFSGDFVGQLRDLPPVKVNHTEVDWTLYRFDNTLEKMQEQIRNAEAAYGTMRAEERQRKTELPSVDGSRVRATPAEHLKNMRATFEQQRKFRENMGKTFSSRWMMDKVRWSAVYEMDARKTDSILTPYVGTITMAGTWYSDETTKRETQNYRFTFAGQDEKWVLRSATRVLSDGKTLDVALIEGGQGLYFKPLMAHGLQSP